MSRRGLLENKLMEMQRRGEKALIPYICGGDPGLEETVRLVPALALAGADVVEIGIPFSDPVADGPVIQKAAARALAAGATTAKILGAVTEIRRHTDVPIVLMSYYNPIYSFGVEKFAEAAVDAGVDGVIVPDIPLEESGPLRQAAAASGLAVVPLVAPNSGPERLAAITAAGSGFIYCVSVKGVTGVRQEIDTDITKFISCVRSHTKLPLAVGFGISGPEQAAQMAGYCDAVVVGSALVEIISGKGKSPDLIPAVARRVREIKQALNGLGGFANAAI
jgi:tryptophan synthase alpha chain